MLTSSLIAMPALLSWPGWSRAAEARIANKLADLEHSHGGRLGVAMLDTGTGRQITHRSAERFAMCSTFKCAAAGFVLARVDRQQESLSRRVRYNARDLLRYSPVTERHFDTGMTIGELCEAAITLSDNTAANLLLDSIGGPPALTGWLRTLGDSVTRLDRREPELNNVQPGDVRDTTTPIAMLATLRRLTLGDALSATSRQQLTAWLVASKTGDQRLRAGVPPGWRIGDKTGTGDNNIGNDIAVLWPPSRSPVVVTAYYAGSKAQAAERDAVLAEVGGLAVALAES
jgi:beta-lactamase class A